jgi:hypothetical protein
MPTDTPVRDELLDQVLEDERMAALHDFRERQEIAINAVEMADV